LAKSKFFLAFKKAGLMWPPQWGNGKMGKGKACILAGFSISIKYATAAEWASLES